MNENPRKLKEIGAFLVTSSSMVITDPCYRFHFIQLNLAHHLHVLNGIWCGFIYHVNIETWGQRSTHLFAIHETISPFLLNDYETWEASVKAPVDSGFCGIYDSSIYRQKSSNDRLINELCFNLDTNLNTSKKNLAQVVQGGVISTSGYGDGYYPVFLKNKQTDGSSLVVGIAIEFIKIAESTPT